MSDSPEEEYEEEQEDWGGARPPTPPLHSGWEGVVSQPL